MFDIHLVVVLFCMHVTHTNTQPLAFARIRLYESVCIQFHRRLAHFIGPYNNAIASVRASSYRDTVVFYTCADVRVVDKSIKLKYITFVPFSLFVLSNVEDKTGVRECFSPISPTSTFVIKIEKNRQFVDEYRYQIVQCLLVICVKCKNYY